MGDKGFGRLLSQIDDEVSSLRSQKKVCSSGVVLGCVGTRWYWQVEWEDSGVQLVGVNGKVSIYGAKG